MSLVKNLTSYTITPAVTPYPGIPPYTYCPPCSVIPAGGSGPPPTTGGNGNPGDPGGGGSKVTCVNIPTGSTCVIVNGQPVGVNCQTIYTTVCR